MKEEAEDSEVEKKKATGAETARESTRVDKKRQRYIFKVPEEDSDIGLPDKLDPLAPKLKRTTSQQRHIGKRVRKKTQRGRPALTQSSSVSSITLPRPGRDKHPTTTDRCALSPNETAMLLKKELLGCTVKGTEVGSLNNKAHTEPPGPEAPFKDSEQV